MTRFGRPAAVLLSLAVGCGPAGAPPPSPVPTNHCSTDGDCASSGSGVTCATGACVVADGAFDFNLIVSLPESAIYGAGVDVPIAGFRNFVTQTPCRSSAPSPVSCVDIPQVTDPEGSLLIAADVIQQTGSEAYFGSLLETTTVAAPVRARYYPQWPTTSSTADAGITVDATEVGLPLDPIDALIGYDSFIPGPYGSQAIFWHAPLASSGAFELDVVPQDPVLPVTTTLLDSPGSDELQNPDKTFTEWPFTVTRASGPSLDGFTVWLRDSRTLRRASSLATLSGQGTASFTLFTFGVSNDSFDLVVAPPAGAVLPYLADHILAVPVASHPAAEEFPDLPGAVTVSGSTVGPDGRAIQATLVVDSVPSGITLNGTDTRTLPFLHYSTSATTDVDGHYALTLPPGAYDVFVTPVSGSGAGSTSVTLVVRPPLTTGGDAVAAGKTLQAAALSVISGSAAAADGRPMAGATVVAKPAVSLAGVLDPRRWPRSQTTIADANGQWSLVVDPGTYDIVVEPEPGSGFPWAVSSSQVIPTGQTVRLPPIVVPAPVLVDLIFHDPEYEQPLVGALLRAFAPAKGAQPATPGAPLPMVEIGRWSTDGSGHATMFVAPP